MHLLMLVIDPTKRLDSKAMVDLIFLSPQQVSAASRLEAARHFVVSP